MLRDITARCFNSVVGMTVQEAIIIFLSYASLVKCFIYQSFETKFNLLCDYSCHCEFEMRDRNFSQN